MASIFSASVKEDNCQEANQISAEINESSPRIKENESAANDPDFGVICAFLQKFAKDVGIDLPNFNSLHQWLINTDEVSQQLRDMHIKLMRKIRRTVHEKGWEVPLSKFCFSYSAQDAWEIERFGYKKSSLKVKLRVLRHLLECQFERNNKFRTKLLTLSADSLRSQPIGRDKSGHTYWLTQDDDCNLRIYQEHLDEEIWQVVASNRDELVNLIARLRGNEVVLPSADIGVIDEDTSSSSNSCAVPVERPPPPEEQDDSQEEPPALKVPNLRIKLNTPKKSNEHGETGEKTEKENLKTENITEKVVNKESEESLKKVKPIIIQQSQLGGNSPTSSSKRKAPPNSDEITASPVSDEPRDLKRPRPCLLDSRKVSKPNKYFKHSKGEEEYESSSLDDESELDDEEDDEEECEEEDIDSAAAEEGENEEKDIEDFDDSADENQDTDGIGKPIEDPTVYVRGNGSGKECDGVNPIYFIEEFPTLGNELSEAVGEIIEEEIFYICGEGAGEDCQVGNKTQENETTTTPSLEPKATFFFGEPGCLKLSPIKLAPPTATTTAPSSPTKVDKEEDASQEQEQKQDQAKVKTTELEDKLSDQELPETSKTEDSLQAPLPSVKSEANKSELNVKDKAQNSQELNGENKQNTKCELKEKQESNAKQVDKLNNYVDITSKCDVKVDLKGKQPDSGNFNESEKEEKVAEKKDENRENNKEAKKEDEQLEKLDSPNDSKQMANPTANSNAAKNLIKTVESLQSDKSTPITPTKPVSNASVESLQSDKSTPITPTKPVLNASPPSAIQQPIHFNRKRRLTDFSKPAPPPPHPQLTQKQANQSESDFDTHSDQHTDTSNTPADDNDDIGGKRLKIRPKCTNTEIRKKVEAQLVEKKHELEETTSSSGDEETRRPRKMITPKRNVQKLTLPASLSPSSVKAVENTNENSKPKEAQTINTPTAIVVGLQPMSTITPTSPLVKTKPTLSEIIEKKLKKTPPKSTHSAEVVGNIELPLINPSTSAIGSIETPTNFSLPKKSPITKPLKKNLLNQLRESDDEAVPRKRTISTTIQNVAQEAAAATQEQVKPIVEDIATAVVTTKKVESENSKSTNQNEPQKTTKRATPDRQRKRQSSEEACPLKTTTLTEKSGTEDDECNIKTNSENVKKCKEDDTTVKKEEAGKDKQPTIEKDEEKLMSVETKTEDTTNAALSGRRSSRRCAASVVYAELPQPKRTRGGGAAKIIPTKNELGQEDATTAGTDIKTDGEKLVTTSAATPAAAVKEPEKKILPKKETRSNNNGDVQESSKKIEENNRTKTENDKKIKVETTDGLEKVSNPEDDIKANVVKKEPSAETTASEPTPKNSSTKTTTTNNEAVPTTTNTKGTTPAAKSATSTSPASASATTPASTGRGRGVRKKREVDMTNIIETANDAETPVRQSRRIAQQKIREEAERRKLEEIALRSMKQELKKKKKAEKEADPTVVEPSADEPSSSSTSSESENETTKTKRKSKKKLPGKDGWSSGSEEEDEPEEEEEHPPHYETDPGSPLFRSDHEFSPESDIEDETQAVPMKRARTVRKEDADEIDEGDEEACQKCGKSDHPEWILLCDNCDKGYHCSCLSPVLFYIPEGNWYCPPCQQAQLIVALEKQLFEFDELVERKRIEQEEKKLLAEAAEREEQARLKEEEEHRKERRKQKQLKKRHVDGDSDSSDDSGKKKGVENKHRDDESDVVTSKKHNDDDDDDSEFENGKQAKASKQKDKNNASADKHKRRRGEGRNRRRKAAARGTRRRRRLDKGSDSSGSGSGSSSGSRSGGSRSGSSSGTDSSSSGSSGSGFSDSDDEPIYKLRKRRQINVSYRLNEYDDLINSALKKEMDEVAGAGNLGRGKDISTIIEADKEEKARIKEIEEKSLSTEKAAGAPTPVHGENSNDPVEKANEDDGENEDDENDDDNVIKQPKMKAKPRPTIKKKARKLTTLDISSEDDGSDEDFKTSSFDDDDEEEDTLISGSTDSDTSLEIYRRRGKGGKKKKQRKAARRAARQRRKDRRFVVEESDDDEEAVAKPKKKRKEQSDYTETETEDDDLSENSENIDSAELCDDTTSDSDGAWHPSKRKKQRKSGGGGAASLPQVASSKSKPKKPQTKKPKQLEYSDDDISESEEEEDDEEDDIVGGGKGSGKQPRSQPLIPVKSSVNKNNTATQGKGKGKGNSNAAVAAKKKQGKKKKSEDESSFSSGSEDSTRARTRGRRYAYIEDFDDDSSDGGIKPGVHRPDTPPEEREKFIKKQEEIKRMLAEKNAEAAKLAATTQPQAAAADKRSPAAKQDSLSTVPLSVIRQAKVLDIDYLQRKGGSLTGELDNVDDDVNSEFDDADLPDDLPEDMDEDAIARMVEEEEEFGAANAVRELPQPDDIMRTPTKSAKAKEVVAAIQPLPLSSTKTGGSAALEALAQMQGGGSSSTQVTNAPAASSSSGLQEPTRKRFPMPTFHPPLLRHQYPPHHPPHTQSGNIMLHGMQHGMPRHGPPPTHLLQNALNAPLGQSLNRSFGHAHTHAPHIAGPPMHSRQLLPSRPPVSPQSSAPVTAPLAPATMGIVPSAEVKPRGRRKKITPLRDSAQKQATAASATATAAVSAANSNSVEKGATLLPSSSASRVVPPTNSVSSVIKSPSTSTLSVAPPPQLYKPQTDLNVSESQASVITRMPHLPPPNRMIFPNADVARFYSSLTSPGSAPGISRSLPPNVQRAHRGSPLQMPPGMGTPPPQGYGAPHSARHPPPHLNPYRPPIYGNPNYGQPRPMPATGHNVRLGTPPTTGPDYISGTRPYPPYGYYPPPPPLTTAHHPPPVSSVIVAAPPSVVTTHAAPVHPPPPPSAPSAISNHAHVNQTIAGSSNSNAARSNSPAKQEEILPATAKKIEPSSPTPSAPSIASQKKLMTLDVYAPSNSKSPLAMGGGESSGSQPETADDSPTATPAPITQTNKAGEFSGLVSYFSSQHDDYNS